MTRSERLAVLICTVALVVALAFLLAMSAHPVDARTSPECWWEGTTLRATGLPSRPFGITYDVPHGVFLTSDDGTYSATLTPGRIVFYTRGGGGALFKWGRQFNDYHPICVAVP